MDARLARHAGKDVERVEPQLVGDLDLALKCYRVLCKDRPVVDDESRMAAALSRSGEFIGQYWQEICRSASLGTLAANC